MVAWPRLYICYMSFRAFSVFSLALLSVWKTRMSSTSRRRSMLGGIYRFGPVIDCLKARERRKLLISLCHSLGA